MACFSRSSDAKCLRFGDSLRSGLRCEHLRCQIASDVGRATRTTKPLSLGLAESCGKNAACHQNFVAHHLAICDPISCDTPYSAIPEDTRIKCDTPSLAEPLCSDRAFVAGQKGVPSSTKHYHTKTNNLTIIFLTGMQLFRCPTMEPLFVKKLPRFRGFFPWNFGVPRTFHPISPNFDPVLTNSDLF